MIDLHYLARSCSSTLYIGGIVQYGYLLGECTAVLSIECIFSPRTDLAHSRGLGLRHVLGMHRVFFQFMVIKCIFHCSACSAEREYHARTNAQSLFQNDARAVLWPDREHCYVHHILCAFAKLEPWSPWDIGVLGLLRLQTRL